MRDFTLKMYEELLAAALRAGFKPVTFAEYMTAEATANKTLILRHDVDRRPKQALKMARLERAMGVKASYYFRRHRQGFAATVIRAVAGLGHEIGYHYEDLGRARGDVQKAIAGFAKNLESLRRLCAVKTICMHGSPIFRFDNRDLWKSRDYHDFGIIGEPYFDIDYTQVLYVTDTGRRWDGDKVNIRDKTAVQDGPSQKLNIKGTAGLIRKISQNAVPNLILLNAHPHRWFDFGIHWMEELIFQNMKNIVKGALLAFRHDR